MRNMSFSMTTEQFKDRSKTVTRRWGWDFLKPGDIVMGVEKAMGLKKGEKIAKIRPILILSANKQPLNLICNLSAYPNNAEKEMELEGFPKMAPWDFVKMLAVKGKKPEDYINRFRFEHLPEDKPVSYCECDDITFSRIDSTTTIYHSQWGGSSYDVIECKHGNRVIFVYDNSAPCRLEYLLDGIAAVSFLNDTHPQLLQRRINNEYGEFPR